MTWRILLFFTLYSSLIAVHAQDISFYKENITMKIEKDYFYVTGDYHLKTSRDSSIILAYPLPVDSLYAEVDSIIVFNVSFYKPVEILNRKNTGIIFRAEFGKEDEIHILIAYRQKLLGNKAEYILKSTAGWGKPLAQADYQLIIPENIRIAGFSIPPDKSMEAGTETVYYWSMSNFMPDRNMVFEFNPVELSNDQRPTTKD